MLDVALVDGDASIRSSYITGDALILQRVETRIRMFLGEGLLNDTLGLPGVDSSPGSKFDVVAFSAQIRRLLLTTPGVAALREFKVDHQRSTRNAVVTGIIVIGNRTPVAFALDPPGPAGLYHHPYIRFHRGRV